MEKLAIWNANGLGARLAQAMVEYCKGYEFDSGDNYHMPTEHERILMEDMLNGALSDDAVSDILQEAARGMKQAGMDPEGTRAEMPASQ